MRPADVVRVRDPEEGCAGKRHAFGVELRMPGVAHDEIRLEPVEKAQALDRLVVASAA